MPPVVIAGALAAAGTIGGAVLASGASNSAANTAAQSQQQATNAQLQLGQQSLALNQGIYNSNYNLLSPDVSRGNVAAQNESALLGLPSAPTLSSPLAQPAATAPAQTGPTLADVMALQHDGIPGDFHPAMAAYNARANSFAPAQHVPTPVGAPIPVSPAPSTPAASNALSPTDAFNAFANSAGMQFQLKQGENAIQNNYADKGALQSGAAMKALQSYGQSTALQNYFMPYLSMLGGIANRGAQAGAAVAGVGSSFGNTAANINAQMGGAIQNGADATGNAALVRGANNANIFSGLGTTLGNLGSSFFSNQTPTPQIPKPDLMAQVPVGF